MTLPVTAAAGKCSTGAVRCRASAGQRIRGLAFGLAGRRSPAPGAALDRASTDSLRIDLLCELCREQAHCLGAPITPPPPDDILT